MSAKRLIPVIVLMLAGVLWALAGRPVLAANISYVSRAPSPSPNVIAYGGGHVYFGDGQGVGVYDQADLARVTWIPVDLDENFESDERAGTQGVTGVVYDGGFLYVTCGNEGLQIFEVSDPADPVARGTHIVRIDGHRARAKDVTVNGNYAYVVHKRFTEAGYRTGIQILDISDPDDPQAVGACGTPEAFQLGLAGLVEREQGICYDAGRQHIYISDYSNGVAVYDVSDPANPEHEAWAAIPYAFDVAVSGDYLYVASGGYGLWVIPRAEDNEVTNDELPAEAAVCQYDGSSTKSICLEVDSDYAYVGDNDGGLVVIDVSEPALIDSRLNNDDDADNDVDIEAALARYAPDMSGLFSLQVDPSGDLQVYVGNRINGLQKITLNNAPGNAMAWSLAGVPDASPTPTPADGNAFALDQDMDTEKSYLYVVDDDAGDQEGFYVYFARFSTDWIDFLFKGFLATAGEALDVCVSGDYAYVADGTAGLKIIDPGLPEPDAEGNLKVKETANPVLHGSAALGTGRAVKLAVAGNYAYVAAEQGGLRIFDIANPANPAEVGALAGADIAWANSVAVEGDYAYVAAGLEGLQVVDITDKSDPVLVGSYDALSGSAADVDLVGDKAYVGCRRAGNHVSRYDDGTGNWSAQAPVVGLDVDAIAFDNANQLAYLGTNENGLRLFDLTNQAWLRSYTTADGLAGNNIEALVLDSANNLWIGTFNNGLSQLDLDTETWTTYTTDDGLAGYKVESLALGSEGGDTILWVGTDGYGLNKYNINTDTWTTYDTDNSDLANDEIEGIVIDDDGAGDIWCATDGGGVYKYAPATDTWTPHNSTTDPGIPYDEIEAIALSTNAAGQEIIWIGCVGKDNDGHNLGGGVSYYNIANPGGGWTNFNTANSGLVQDEVIALAVQSMGLADDDHLCFGTYGGGVSHYDPGTGIWTDHTAAGSAYGLADNYVETLAVDGNGDVWAGFFAEDGGVYVVDLSDPENPAFSDARTVNYANVLNLYAAASDEDPETDLIWTARGLGGLGFLSNPPSVSMQTMKIYDSSGFVRDVMAFGFFAVLAEDAGGVQVVGVETEDDAGTGAWYDDVTPTDLSSGHGSSSSSGCFIRSLF